MRDGELKLDGKWIAVRWIETTTPEQGCDEGPKRIIKVEDRPGGKVPNTQLNACSINQSNEPISQTFDWTLDGTRNRTLDETGVT